MKALLPDLPMMQVSKRSEFFLVSLVTNQTQTPIIKYLHYGSKINKQKIKTAAKSEMEVEINKFRDV